MKGSFPILVRNNRVQFKFVVERNLTILRGNSATGKTTLLNLIADYEQNGPESGIVLESAAPCTVVAGNTWQAQLSSIASSIVFIDEGNRFIHTPEFARAAKASDNYYVLVTRRDYPTLPYSVEEIYRMKNETKRRQKDTGVERFYSSFHRMYEDLNPGFDKPEAIVVEDSKSGFEFYRALCVKEGIRCISAEGKGNIRASVIGLQENNVLVIADGAAFGPHIDAILKLRALKNVRVFLPESFEWVLLNSGVIPDKDIPAILENPSEYIESKEYFSWEVFFTDLLERRTKETRLAYTKSRLNKAFLHAHYFDRIASTLPDCLRG